MVSGNFSKPARTSLELEEALYSKPQLGSVAEKWVFSEGWIAAGGINDNMVTSLGEAEPCVIPSAVFIQAARQDGVAGEKYAKQFYELTSQPKKLGIYDASHALNAGARQDRVSWLQEQLRLRPIPAAWLGKLPETK
jgi:hypothetical protein